MATKYITIDFQEETYIEDFTPDIPHAVTMEELAEAHRKFLENVRTDLVDIDLPDDREQA